MNKIKNNEYLLLQYRLQLNKRLLEKDYITMEVFQKMENKLISKIYKLNGGKSN